MARARASRFRPAWRWQHTRSGRSHLLEMGGTGDLANDLANRLAEKRADGQFLATIILWCSFTAHSSHASVRRVRGDQRLGNVESCFAREVAECEAQNRE